MGNELAELRNFEKDLVKKLYGDFAESRQVDLRRKVI